MRRTRKRRRKRIRRVALGRRSGPFLTGLISDSLTAELGNMALGRALLIVPVAQVVAVGCYLLASRRYLDQVLDA